MGLGCQSSSPDLYRESGVKVVPFGDRLVGLVVKASTLRAEGPGFESRLLWDFNGVES